MDYERWPKQITTLGYVDWIVIDVDSQWTNKETEVLALVIENLQDSFRALIIFSVTGRDKLADIRASVGNTLPNEWNWVSYRMDATYYGDPIETDVGVCVLSPYLAELSTMKPEHRPPSSLQGVLSKDVREYIQPLDRRNDETQASTAISVTIPTNCDLLPVVELKTDPSYKALSEQRAQPAYFVSEGQPQVPVFSPQGPAPPMSRLPETSWQHFPFAILWGEGMDSIRGVNYNEVLQLFGAHEDRRRLILTQGADHEDIVQSTAGCVPAGTRAAIFEMVKLAKDTSAKPPDKDQVALMMALYRVPTVEGLMRYEVQALLSLNPMELNTDTSLPIPNEAEWRMAVDLCVETSTVMDAVEDAANANVNHLKKHGYYQEWKHKRLEVEDGTLYRYEASV